MHCALKLKVSATVHLMLLFTCVQEIIILTLSTMWWEDDALSTVNVTGMIICVAGITTHTTVKVWGTHSKFHRTVLQTIMSR